MENPDLPIVVVAGKDANTEDYDWMYCSEVSCFVTEILDCKPPYDPECVIDDEDDLKEQIVERLSFDTTTVGITDKKFDKMVADEMKRYEPYWKKVIAIYVDN